MDEMGQPQYGQQMDEMGQPQCGQQNGNNKLIKKINNVENLLLDFVKKEKHLLLNASIIPYNDFNGKIKICDVKNEHCEHVQGSKDVHDLVIKLQNDKKYIIYDLDNFSLKEDNSLKETQSKYFKIKRIIHMKDIHKHFDMPSDFKMKIYDNSCIILVHLENKNTKKSHQSYALHYHNNQYKIKKIKSRSERELEPNININKYIRNFLFYISSTDPDDFRNTEPFSNTKPSLKEITDLQIKKVKNFRGGSPFINTSSNNYQELFRSFNSIDLNPKEGFFNTPTSMTNDFVSKTENELEGATFDSFESCEKFDPKKHFKINDIPCTGCNF